MQQSSFAVFQPLRTHKNMFSSFVRLLLVMLLLFAVDNNVLYQVENNVPFKETCCRPLHLQIFHFNRVLLLPLYEHIEVRKIGILKQPIQGGFHDNKRE